MFTIDGKQATKFLLSNALFGENFVTIESNGFKVGGKVTSVQMEDGGGHNYNVTIQTPPAGPFAGKSSVVFIRTID